MKHLNLLIGILLITSPMLGQDGPKSNDDTTKIKMGNMTIIFNDDEDDFDFDMEDSVEVDEKSIGVNMDFTIGMNGWLNTSNSTVFSSEYSDMSLQMNKSRVFGMHAMLTGLDVFKGHLFFSPGLGFSWNNYHFENKMMSMTMGNDTTIFMVDSSRQFDKYKLRTAYAELPLVIGTRIGNLEKTHLNLQFGVIGGINISSVVKQRYFVNSVKFNEKIKDDFNVNPFKLDLIAKLKFSDHIGVYGRYSLTSMFEKGKTQEVYPFAVGITIGGI